MYPDTQGTTNKINLKKTLRLSQPLTVQIIYRLGYSTNKSQAPEDGCINIRNMLSIK
jgi:hypothetical protein